MRIPRFLDHKLSRPVPLDRPPVHHHIHWRFAVQEVRLNADQQDGAPNQTISVYAHFHVIEFVGWLMRRDPILVSYEEECHTPSQHPQLTRSKIININLKVISHYLREILTDNQSSTTPDTCCHGIIPGKWYVKDFLTSMNYSGIPSLEQRATHKLNTRSLCIRNPD